MRLRTLPLVALAALLLVTARPAAGMRCADAPAASCSHQMPHLNLSRDDCIVEYYPSNSSECAGLRLAGDRCSRRLGAVRLRPYLWTDDEGTPLTALNVSLLDARWARLVLRLSPLDGSSGGSACRAVRLSEHALAASASAGRPPQLHWPCPWCGHGCEARAFSLEYSATGASGAATEYGRFLFSLPPHTYVGEPGVPFPYVEVSSLPRVHVRWPPPPPPGAAPLYSVATLVDGRRVAALTVPAAQQELEVDAGAAGGGGGGAVSFSVRALLPNCSLCADVRTPPLKLERGADAPFLWLAAGVAAVGGGLLLMGRLLLRAAGRGAQHARPAVAGPRVLLLYRPVSAAHVSVVRRLAAYLRAAGCRVLLDDEDVPRSEHKDPLKWYSTQLLAADVALVVASPCAAPAAPASPAGVYGPAAAAAESLLGARLSRGGRCEALALPCRRPRCRCRPRLPPPARGLRLLRARRPSDLRRLLRRLRATSAPGDAAAGELLRAARESAGSCLCLCPQQEPTEETADESSDAPEPCEPDLEAEPAAALVTSPAASSALDLQSLNLLGPHHSAEETHEEDDGLLREINVTTWTSAGQPLTVSLEL